MRTLLTLLVGTLILAAPAAAADRLTSKPRPTPPAVKPLAVGDEVRTGSGQRRRLTLPDGSVLYVNQSTTLKLKAARQEALRALRDKTELFEGGDNLIKLGKHRFNVSTQAVELTLVPRRDEATGKPILFLHLTGTDFYEQLAEPRLRGAALRLVHGAGRGQHLVQGRRIVCPHAAPGVAGNGRQPLVSGVNSHGSSFPGDPAEAAPSRICCKSR